MLKSLILSAADRLIVSSLLPASAKATVSEARNVRTIRQRLEIRDLSKGLTKLNAYASEAGLPEVGWDDLEDPAEAKAEAQEKIANSGEDKALSDALTRYADQLDKTAVIRAYTLDDAYLHWLIGLTVDKDWNKVKLADEQGNLSTVETIASPPLLEAYANAVDKISAALVAPGLAEKE